jgi:hypothetical protein
MSLFGRVLDEEIRMTPEERFEAIRKLLGKMELSMVETGNLLSEMKRMRTYKIKGYKSFKEFTEAEYNLPGRVANSLTKMYDFFIREMNLDEDTINKIGFDKLELIHPIVKDTSYEVQEEWVKTAEDLTYPELNEKVKEIKVKAREEAKTLKDVLVEQYFENMLGYFNCSKRELSYKLALYFQDMDLQEVNEVIRKQQRKFEEEVEKSSH